MKQKYESPLIDIILFDSPDIITKSDTSVVPPQFDEEALGGAGYDSGGWT